MMRLKTSCLVVVAALLAGGCSKNDPATSQVAAPQVLSVQVAPVRAVAWDKTVSIVGTLHPKDEATVSAQVEGSVEKTFVDFGDRVKEDQNLALIDTTLYEAQLEQAAGNLAKSEANLSNAVRNYDRVARLRKDNIASESAFDDAKSLVDQARAEVKAEHGAESIARVNLEHSHVRAPFEGGISQRLVGRGDYVKIGSPLYNMVNDTVLKFVFQVPEKYGSLVRKGLPVSFNVDNYPGQNFTGSVYLISPSVTMTARSFGVGALVTNLDFRLKAGTFARGNLVLGKGTPTPAVPLEAVVSFAGVTKVFVVESEIARSRTVVTGRVQDGLQEILSGVKPGEQAVVTGQTRLIDGMKVGVRATASTNSTAEPKR